MMAPPIRFLYSARAISFSTIATMQYHDGLYLKRCIGYTACFMVTY